MQLEFAIRRSGRRRSIELVVERNGSLTVLAPNTAPTAKLERFVRDKRMWVYRKLAERDLLNRPESLKEFVTGESFEYLGRTYRLQLVEHQDRPLKLLNGRFRLRWCDADQARSLFVAWYCERGKAWLTDRVIRWSGRMAVVPGPIVVRDLGRRWGSCGKANRLNFHWAVMALPISTIDYLIVHELAHIDVPTHGTKFWQRVARTMPDYQQRKAWLDENGGKFASL